THPRHEGGDHDPERLTTLCGAHHRATHASHLLIKGSWSSGYVYEHADGSSYGGDVSAERASLFADAFSGLVNLGFGHTESQRALDRVRSKAGPLTLAQVLTRALRELRGE